MIHCPYQSKLFTLSIMMSAAAFTTIHTARPRLALSLSLPESPMHTGWTTQIPTSLSDDFNQSRCTIVVQPWIINIMWHNFPTDLYNFGIRLAAHSCQAGSYLIDDPLFYKSNPKGTALQPPHPLEGWELELTPPEKRLRPWLQFSSDILQHQTLRSYRSCPEGWTRYRA